MCNAQLATHHEFKSRLGEKPCFLLFLWYQRSTGMDRERLQNFRTTELIYCWTCWMISVMSEKDYIYGEIMHWWLLHAIVLLDGADYVGKRWLWLMMISFVLRSYSTTGTIVLWRVSKERASGTLFILYIIRANTISTSSSLAQSNTTPNIPEQFSVLPVNTRTTGASRSSKAALGGIVHWYQAANNLNQTSN